MDRGNTKEYRHALDRTKSLHLGRVGQEVMIAYAAIATGKVTVEQAIAQMETIERPESVPVGDFALPCRATRLGIDLASKRDLRTPETSRWAAVEAARELERGVFGK